MITPMTMPSTIPMNTATMIPANVTKHVSLLHTVSHQISWEFCSKRQSRYKSKRALKTLSHRINVLRHRTASHVDALTAGTLPYALRCIAMPHGTASGVNEPSYNCKVCWALSYGPILSITVQRPIK